MQINPAVTQLSLYDIVGTPGVAADISHINSKAKVQVCRPQSNKDCIVTYCC